MSDSKISVAQFQRQIECAVCLEVYKQPKSLPCGHVFCRECIDRLAPMEEELSLEQSQDPSLNSDSHRNVHCPQCRKSTTLAENGATDLPTAFIIQEMIDLVSRARLNIGEQTGPAASSVSVSVENEPLSLRSELDTRFKILKMQINNMKDSLGILGNRENEIRRQGKSIHEDIDNFIHRIINTVEQYGNQLKESLNQLIQHKIRKLNAQREDCEIALVQLQSLLTSEDLARQQGADIADIIERLQLACKEVNVDAYYPQEEANIKFLANESVFDKISLSAVGKVATDDEHAQPPLPRPPVPSPRPPVPSPQPPVLFHQQVLPRQTLRATCVRRDVSVVNVPSSFDIQLDAPTDDPLLCTLVLGNSGYRINCEVQQVRRGLYRMLYVPKATGIYYIQLEMERNDVVCNPSSIVVSPAFEIRLKEAKRAATAISKPWGIAITYENTMVITTKDSSIWVLTLAWPHNRILQLGRKGTRQGEYRFPTGIAVTPDNHILVVDADNHCLQRVTTQGRPLDRVGLRGAGTNDENELKYPYGVGVDKGGRVFVTDTGNHRVQVLNPDLSFSHIFGEKGNGDGQFNCPVGVAVDQQGCVYVCDRDNSRIQKFSNDGRYMSQFGQGALKIPFYVTVDSNNLVYVTDNKSREVVVFDVNGKCYASLQMLGEPRGIATDIYGRIYVCNFGRNGIMTF